MPKALNREATFLDVTQKGERTRIYLHANPGTVRHYDIDELTFWTDELVEAIGGTDEAQSKLDLIEEALREQYRFAKITDSSTYYGQGMRDGKLAALRSVAKILDIDLD